MPITYRKFKAKDKKLIEKYIKEAWFDEEDVSERARITYSKGYFYMYMMESNYVDIAVNENDECVGFVFGEGKHSNFFKKIFYFFPYFFTGVKMLFSKDGRQGLQIELITHKVNRKLKRQVGFKIEGQLNLFIVNSAYRKNGIGTTLQNHFIDYLLNHGSHNYSLFTDTYSNYHYYDANGFKRCGEMDVDFKMESERDENGNLPKYFIYIRDISK